MSSWEEYYGDRYEIDKKVEGTKERQDLSHFHYVHVLNSEFNDCSTDIYLGGAISIMASKTDIISLIEYSLFNKCYITAEYSVGGAIYTYSCECIINGVCSNGCYASNPNSACSGQFCHLISLSSQNIIHIYSSSIISSTPENGHSTINILNGNQSCSYDNISNNIVYYCSTICYYINHQSLEFNKRFIKYCSITNNKVSEYYCIYLKSSSSYDVRVLIDTCNIINNTQPETSIGGLLRCEKITNIVNCCIMENIGSPLFQACSMNTNLMITIYIQNCTLEVPVLSNSKGYKEGSVKLIGDPLISLDERFINKLRFIETAYCLTGFDSANISYMFLGNSFVPTKQFKSYMKIRERVLFKSIICLSIKKTI